MVRPGTKSDFIGICIATAGIAIAIGVHGWHAPQIPHEAEYERAAPRPTVVPAGFILPTATPKYANAPCGCAYDAYQCEDFKHVDGSLSQPGAQLCFNWCMEQVGTDVHNLVIDNPSDAYVWDGFACKERVP